MINSLPSYGQFCFIPQMTVQRFLNYIFLNRKIFKPHTRNFVQLKNKWEIIKYKNPIKHCII